MIVDPIENIAKSLKKEEGFRAQGYECSMGFLSIGFGRNISNTGPGITEAEAEMLLMNDIHRTLEECYKAFPFFENLSSERRSAVCQLVFQLGLTTFRKFHKTLRHLEDGEFDLAADELLRSRFAEQTPARAKRMAKLLRETS